MSWMNLNLQDPNSISMFKINIFNNLMMMILINLMMILIIMTHFNFKNKFNFKSLLNNQKLEIMWTLMPLIIIFIISIMSINILFNNNNMKLNFINIKTTSNQWFWNYEYMNFNISFNSYLMINNNFNFFMIETNNNLIIPFNFQIMMILTSMDVIHSWTIPSLNIKMDCIPNQLNTMLFIINKPTILYGQCSEICGINHSFMPIKIESININNFLKWIQ